MGFLTITLQGIEKKPSKHRWHGGSAIPGMPRHFGSPQLLNPRQHHTLDTPTAGPTSPGDRCSPVDLSLKAALVYSDLNQSAVSYSAIATAKNSN